MRLQAGHAAPILQVTTLQGQTATLPERGHKLWLAFFRYAACPLCNIRIAEIRRDYQRLTSTGLRIVAVVQSGAASIQKYMQGGEWPLVFIPDPTERLYQAYHVEKSLAGFLSLKNIPALLEATRKKLGGLHPEGTTTRLPADFLIDEQGIVQHAFYANRIAEHIDFQSVYTFAGL